MIKKNKVTNARGCVLRLMTLCLGLFLLVKENIMATGYYGYSSEPPLFSPVSGYGTNVNGWNYVQSGPSGGSWSQTAASQPSNAGVLGASTINTPTPAPTPTPSGGGDGGGNSGPSMQDLLNQQYESLFSQLGEQEGRLSEQRSNQEQIAQNTYSSGEKRLTGQYSQSKKDIESGQAKTLADLTDALVQGFRQGNIMLGTRGASDSSAANMYSYALNKLGAKQRGDIMQENARRLDSLKQTYDMNINDLATQRDNQLLNIANWFSESQNKIGGMRAELQAQKTSELVQLAQQAIAEVKQNVLNQKSVLDEWAANTASSLPQLTQMLAQNAQNLPAFQSLYGGLNYGGVGGQSMFGFGNESNERMNMFGV